MIAKDSFIILQSGTELTGALCRIGLKSREVSYLHRVTCADLTPQAVASGLRSLLDGLAAAGLKRPDDVRVCLSVGATLFRDWAFPFRSRAKVEQALSLLLETEFPFDADTLSHRVCLTGNAAASAGYKSGAQAISVSLRKEERDLWLDAFKAEGLFPRLVTVDPFPLLTNLPSRQNGIALFLHVQRECSAVALLDNGTIRRIRAIPVGWTPETDAASLNISSSEQENAALRGLADRLRRETSLVLEGTPFVPDRLLAYGEAFLGNGASARFAEAFELPVSVLGQEVPLAGQVARLGETDPSRLLALCAPSRPRGVRPCSLRSTVLRREAIFPANTAGVWHGRPAARLPWARPASPPFGRKDTPPDSRPCAMRTPPAPCSARRSPTCAARSTPCRWRASSKTALPDCAAAGRTTPHSRPSICCRTCTPPCRTPSTSASTA